MKKKFTIFLIITYLQTLVPIYGIEGFLFMRYTASVVDNKDSAIITNTLVNVHEAKLQVQRKQELLKLKDWLVFGTKAGVFAGADIVVEKVAEGTAKIIGGGELVKGQTQELLFLTTIWLGGKAAKALAENKTISNKISAQNSFGDRGDQQRIEILKGNNLAPEWKTEFLNNLRVKETDPVTKTKLAVNPTTKFVSKITPEMQTISAKTLRGEKITVEEMAKILPKDGLMVRGANQESVWGFLNKEERFTKYGNDVFVTPYEDVANIKTPTEFSRAMQLFKDEKGLEYRRDANTIIVFKYKNPESLAEKVKIPMEIPGGRKYGFKEGLDVGTGRRHLIMESKTYKEMEAEGVEVVDVYLMTSEGGMIKWKPVVKQEGVYWEPIKEMKKTSIGNPERKTNLDLSSKDLSWVEEKTSFPLSTDAKNVGSIGIATKNLPAPENGSFTSKPPYPNSAKSSPALSSNDRVDAVFVEKRAKIDADEINYWREKHQFEEIKLNYPLAEEAIKAKETEFIQWEQQIKSRKAELAQRQQINNTAILNPEKGAVATAVQPKPQTIDGKSNISKTGPPPGKYSQTTIEKAKGFPDQIEQLAKKENITLTKFQELTKKTADELSIYDLKTINNIRETIPKPDSQTLMQKIIPKAEIQNYLKEENPYTDVRGYVTKAADAKHLKTYEDLYYGERLDYEGSKFNLNDESCGVIRFKSPDTENVVVPRNPANYGWIEDNFPFTGHGFTTGKNGRLGVPEYHIDRFEKIKDGSELWEVYKDGREELRGVYSKTDKRFIPIK